MSVRRGLARRLGEADSVLLRLAGVSLLGLWCFPRFRRRQVVHRWFDRPDVRVRSSRVDHQLGFPLDLLAILTAAAVAGLGVALERRVDDPRLALDDHSLPG